MWKLQEQFASKKNPGRRTTVEKATWSGSSASWNDESCHPTTTWTTFPRHGWTTTGEAGCHRPYLIFEMRRNDRCWCVVFRANRPPPKWGYVAEELTLRFQIWLCGYNLILFRYTSPVRPSQKARLGSDRGCDSTAANAPDLGNCASRTAVWNEK